MCFCIAEGCLAAENIVAPVEILPANTTNKALTPGISVPVPSEQPAVFVPVVNTPSTAEAKNETKAPQQTPADIQSKTSDKPQEVTIQKVPPPSVAVADEAFSTVTNEAMRAKTHSLSAESGVVSTLKVGTKTDTVKKQEVDPRAPSGITVTNEILLVKTNNFSAESGVTSILKKVGTINIVKKQEDAVKEQAQIISDELAAAKLKLQEFSPNRNVGMLKDLERKAMAYDSLSTKLELKDQMIEKLRMELQTAQSAITNQQAEIVCLVTTTNELGACIKKLTEEKAPLKEALDVLRLGKYEYYQIEDKDTCESIAAKPSVYGDASKHTLIRQANKGNVANLDKLVPGEVLIIPRITVSERHDF